jgi:uncharacterized protein (DUF58 family)
VGVVNPLGWTVLALGLLLALVGVAADWRELGIVAVACLLLLLLALPFLLGRTRVRVELLLDPERIVAGGTVAGNVAVTNLAGRLLPIVLELPVGGAVHRYSLPTMGAGARYEETFTIRTDRRGVIPVGPVTTRRGDPVGLFSRDAPWTGVTEILVRPTMVPLESLGSGLLRDLEGVTTDSMSQSDLAFHALREYVPGDDLRHVHWRSSAKAMAAAGENQLLVRQYLDTRRSHATVVVDDDAGSWADPEDFETAMSVAASIVTRAVLDEFETSFACGGQATSGADGNLTLDAICCAEPGATGLVQAATRAAAMAPDTSLLFLLTGGRAPFESLLRSAAVFPPEVSRYALLVDTERASTVTETAGLPVLRLASRDDLGSLLLWSTR